MNSGSERSVHQEPGGTRVASGSLLSGPPTPVRRTDLALLVGAPPPPPPPPHTLPSLKKKRNIVYSSSVSQNDPRQATRKLAGVPLSEHQKHQQIQRLDAVVMKSRHDDPSVESILSNDRYEFFDMADPIADSRSMVSSVGPVIQSSYSTLTPSVDLKHLVNGSSTLASVASSSSSSERMRTLGVNQNNLPVEENIPPIQSPTRINDQSINQQSPPHNSSAANSSATEQHRNLVESAEKTQTVPVSQHQQGLEFLMSPKSLSSPHSSTDRYHLNESTNTPSPSKGNDGFRQQNIDRYQLAIDQRYHCSPSNHSIKSAPNFLRTSNYKGTEHAALSPSSKSIKSAAPLRMGKSRCKNMTSDKLFSLSGTDHESNHERYQTEESQHHRQNSSQLEQQRSTSPLKKRRHQRKTEGVKPVSKNRGSLSPKRESGSAGSPVRRLRSKTPDKRSKTTQKRSKTPDQKKTSDRGSRQNEHGFFRKLFQKKKKSENEKQVSIENDSTHSNASFDTTSHTQNSIGERNATELLFSSEGSVMDQSIHDSSILQNQDVDKYGDGSVSQSIEPIEPNNRRIVRSRQRKIVAGNISAIADDQPNDFLAQDEVSLLTNPTIDVASHSGGIDSNSLELRSKHRNERGKDPLSVAKSVESTDPVGRYFVEHQPTVKTADGPLLLFTRATADHAFVDPEGAAPGVGDKLLHRSNFRSNSPGKVAAPEQHTQDPSPRGYQTDAFLEHPVQDPAGNSPLHKHQRGPSDIKNGAPFAPDPPLHLAVMDDSTVSSTDAGSRSTIESNQSPSQPSLDLSSRNNSKSSKNFLRNDNMSSDSPREKISPPSTQKQSGRVSHLGSMEEETIYSDLEKRASRCRLAESRKKPKIIGSKASLSPSDSASSSSLEPTARLISQGPLGSVAVGRVGKQSFNVSTAAMLNAKTMAYIHNLNGDPSPRNSWNKVESDSEVGSPASTGMPRKTTFSSSGSDAKTGGGSLLFASFRDGKFKDRKPAVPSQETKSISELPSIYKASDTRDKAVESSTLSRIYIRQLRGKANIERSTKCGSFDMDVCAIEEAPAPALKPCVSTLNRNVTLSTTAVAAGMRLFREQREYDVAVGRSGHVIVDKIPNIPVVRSVPRNATDYEDLDPIQRAGRRLLSKAASPIQANWRRYKSQQEAVDRMWALVEIQCYVRRWRAEAALLASILSSVMIQSMIRGYLLRMDYVRLRFSAVLVQKTTRGYLAAVKTYEFVYRIVSTQAVARGWVTRIRLRRHFAAVRTQAEFNCSTTIQSRWRMYCAIKKRKQCLSAIKLQLWWRICSALQLLNRLKAALRLQTRWRICTAVKTVTELKSARVIQCRVRVRKAVKRYTGEKAILRIQTAWRCGHSTKKYRSLKAATMIQMWHRTVQARQITDSLRLSRDTERSAFTVQTWWRVQSAKKMLRTALDAAVASRLQQNEKLSATVLQSWWRANSARMLYDFLRMDTIVVQSVIRRHIAQSRLANLRAERSLSSAIKVQAAWRGFQGYTDFIFRLVDIMVIQRFIRQRLAVMEVEALRSQKAATRIQTMYRAWIATNEACHLRVVQASIKVQTQWRFFRVYSAYTSWRAVLKIQKQWRCFSASKSYRATRSARKIQMLWRLSHSLSMYSSMRAALLIQRQWRRYRDFSTYVFFRAAVLIQKAGRTYVLGRNHIKSQASLIIQNNTRRYFSTKSYRCHRAAIKIQTQVRRGAKHKPYLSNRAAKRVQTKWRCHSTRSLYVSFTSARCIQKYWRCYTMSSAFSAYRAAIKIQTQWRRCSAYLTYTVIRSVVKIQKDWRRCRARYSFVPMRAALILQTQFRRHKARCSLLSHRSAVKIQASVRCLQAHKKYTRFQAAVLVQAHTRRFKARSTYRSFQAAVCIQRALKRFTALLKEQRLEAAIALLNKARRTEIRAQKAAVIIQTNLRRHLVYTSYRSYRAATTVQKQWRCCSAQLMFTIVKSIVTIQKQVRCHSARISYRSHKSAATIQKQWLFYSAFLARRSHKAAVLIQRQWRCHTVRSAYSARKAVVCMQKQWRCYAIHSAYVTMKAAESIQKQWRCHVVESAYSSYRATISIQKNWRCYVARHAFASQLSAVSIQTTWRRHTTQSAYQSYRAATLIQTKWKNRMTDYTKRSSQATTLIQNRWRYYVKLSQHRRVQGLKQAAVTIQREWRCYKAFTNYIFALADVIRIQRTYRSYVAKQKSCALMSYLKETTNAQETHNAAVVVQNSWRGYDMCHAYKRISQSTLTMDDMAHRSSGAATAIQSSWRGYSSWTDYSNIERASVRVETRMSTHAILEERAVVNIQSIWRGFSLRRETQLHENARSAHESARRIQSTWRNRDCSKASNSNARLCCEAAITIQYAWRKFYAFSTYQQRQERVYVNYLHFAASTRIQCCWRKFRDFSRYRQLIDVEKRKSNLSATKIESMWRKHRDQSKIFLRSTVATMKETCDLTARQQLGAASAIQDNWRRSEIENSPDDPKAISRGNIWRKHRESAQSEYRRFRFAATKIECAWRTHRDFSNYIMYNSALKIQSVWRDYFASKQMQSHARLLSEAYLFNQAATSIQKQWRAHHGYMEFVYSLASIIIVQSMVRTFIAKSRAKTIRVLNSEINHLFQIEQMRQMEMLQKQNEQQAFFVDMEAKQKSAVMIQKHWRRCCAQSMLVNDLVSVIMVQAAVRRRAACDIAQMYRVDAVAERVDKFAEKEKSSALSIQSAWRGYSKFCQYTLLASGAAYHKQVQHIANTEANAATTIQSAWRGFWSCTHYVILQYEVVRIQSIVRGNMFRKDYSIQLGCCIMIQASARRYLARKRVQSLHVDQAFTDIEASALRERVAARKVQFWWRVVLDCRREKQAALIIERFFLMIKLEIEREIRIAEERSHGAKKRRSRRRKSQETEEELMEKAWLDSIDTNSSSQTDLFAFTPDSGSDVFDFSPTMPSNSTISSSSTKSPSAFSPSFSKRPISPTKKVTGSGQHISKVDGTLSPVSCSHSSKSSTVPKKQRSTFVHRSSSPSMKLIMRHESGSGSNSRASTEDLHERDTNRATVELDGYRLSTRPSTTRSSSKHRSTSRMSVPWNFGDDTSDIVRRAEEAISRSSSRPSSVRSASAYRSNSRGSGSWNHRSDESSETIRRAQALSISMSRELSENLSLEEAILDAAINVQKLSSPLGSLKSSKTTSSYIKKLGSQGPRTYQSSPRVERFFADDLESEGTTSIRGERTVSSHSLGHSRSMTSDRLSHSLGFSPTGKTSRRSPRHNHIKVMNAYGADMPKKKKKKNKEQPLMAGNIEYLGEEFGMI